MIIAPEPFCIVEGLEDIGETDPVPAVVFVFTTLIVVVVDTVALGTDPVTTVELTPVFGVLTKNQSAATGAPKLASATKFVRLKPTRLSTEVVKLLKKGI